MSNARVSASVTFTTLTDSAMFTGITRVLLLPDPPPTVVRQGEVDSATTFRPLGFSCRALTVLFVDTTSTNKQGAHTMQHTSTTDYDEDVEAFRAFIEELSGYHRAWREHPSYEYAFYMAALAGLGESPRHHCYFEAACDAIHGLADHFGYVPGSVPYNLLHDCLDVAQDASHNGLLVDDEQWHALLALEESGDVLAHLRDERELNDFF